MINLSKYQDLIKKSSPGKYEGEQPATAYYHERMLNGDIDSEVHSPVEGQVAMWTVSKEEATVFGLTEFCFIIKTTEQGFVIGENISLTDWSMIVKDSEDFTEEEEEGMAQAGEDEPEQYLIPAEK